MMMMMMMMIVMLMMIIIMVMVLMMMMMMMVCPGVSCLSVGMKNKIINKSRSTVRSNLATVVRLAFHDCVGNV